VELPWFERLTNASIAVLNNVTAVLHDNVTVAQGELLDLHARVVQMEDTTLASKQT
jgi:hypothetical protein